MEHEAVLQAWYHGEGYGFSYTCGYCGLSVDDHDDYCRHCGAKLVRRKSYNASNEGNAESPGKSGKGSKQAY